LARGLLVSLGGDNIAFAIPQFRDYLAAWALARQGGEDMIATWKRMNPHMLDERWKETISLFPSCLTRRTSSGATQFFDLVGEAYRSESLEVQAQAFCVAGRAAVGVRAMGGSIPQEGPWIQLQESMKKLYEEVGQIVPVQERVLAATVHGLLNDERFRGGQGVWVHIPPGQVELGAQTKDPKMPGFDTMALPWEEPRYQWTTLGFDVRRSPITVTEYSEFINASGYRRREFWTTEAWDWLANNRITGPASWYRQMEVANAPVTGVSWFESTAFCRWLTRVLKKGQVVRLPTSKEWEYVAQRTPLARAIATGKPWKKVCEEGLIGNWSGANLWQKTPVGLFPKSNSEDGVVDLFGNVEEWCEDAWPADVLDAEQEEDLRVQALYNYRIVRGGSTVRVSRLCRPTYYSRCRTEQQYATLGFRPVRSPVDTHRYST